METNSEENLKLRQAQGPGFIYSHAASGKVNVLALPPGLLMLVFEYCTYSGTVPRKGFTWTISDSVALSHVCRQWRAVALKIPDLWNHISMALPEPCIRAAIERSKSSLLDVSAESDSTYVLSPEICDLLFQIFPRAEHIALGTGIELESEPPDNVEAPRLRTLEWFAGSADSLIRAAHSTLQEARVLAYPGVWRSLSMCVHLRHLELCNFISGRPDQSPPLVEVLEALRSLCLLGTLRLHCKFKYKDEGMPSPISLPNLTYICLLGGIIHSSRLLNHLLLPSSTAIKLYNLPSYTRNPLVAAQLDQVIDRLLSRSLGERHRPICVLQLKKLRQFGHSEIVMLGWVNATTLPPNSADHRPLFSLPASPLARLPLHAVRYLHLIDIGNGDPCTITITSLNSVEELHISGCRIPLVSLLFEEKQGGQAFPNLRILRLTNTVGNRERCRDVVSAPLNCSQCIHCLEIALKTWCKGGKKLHLLAISETYESSLLLPSEIVAVTPYVDMLEQQHADSILSVAPDSSRWLP